MHDLAGKRFLVTQSRDFMGPALCEGLVNFGAEVVADERTPSGRDDPQAIVDAAGPIDVLILNLAVPAPSTLVAHIDDHEWRQLFEVLVDPLPRFLRAVLPGMRLRGAGKVIVMGSASALRGSRRLASYSAARGAQLAFVKAVGVELAPENIQVNAIAQNFVDNPTYFPPEVKANPRFQDRLKREVPLGRLVSSREDLGLVAYLSSDLADCFVGQVFPLCGGWAGS
jgi:NAD(P)-dependent dehydrogenase (short-subunit alcohol dehydrogenase family)